MPEHDLDQLFRTCPTPDLHVDPDAVVAGGRTRVRRRRRLVGSALSGAAVLAFVGVIGTSGLPTFGSGAPSGSSVAAASAAGSITAPADPGLATASTSSPPNAEVPTMHSVGDGTAAVGVELGGTSSDPVVTEIVEQTTSGRTTRTRATAVPGFRGPNGSRLYRTPRSGLLLLPRDDADDLFVDLPPALTGDGSGSDATLGGRRYHITWVSPRLTSPAGLVVYTRHGQRWTSSSGEVPASATIDGMSVAWFAQARRLATADETGGGLSGYDTVPSRGITGASGGELVAVPVLPGGAHDITLDHPPVGTTLHSAQVGDITVVRIRSTSQDNTPRLASDLRWTAADGTRWVLPASGPAHRS